MSLQTHARLEDLATRVPAMGPALTPEDWGLILKALGAYQHHLRFRAVYEKLTCD